MALQAILESIDGLPDQIKSEYKKGDDGKFHLDVEGFDDHPNAGALKRAKDYEKTARQKAEKQLKEMQDQLASLLEEREGFLKGAIPKGDVEKLENSYKEKAAKREKELSDQIENMQTHLNTILVDNVANGLAREISKSPDLIFPHIKGRLKAEYVDGRPTTRVLDKEGNPSAFEIEDLKKEMVANPIFAPIIIGSKASGSSADGGPSGSSAPGKLDYSTASPKAIAAHLKAQKESGGN